MSGRSAYVRKKITQTKADEKNPSAAKGPITSPRSPDGSRGAEYGDGFGFDYHDAGYGATNSRLLRFPEALREPETAPGGRPNTISTYSSGGSQSGGSDGGRRDGAAYPQGPMESFAYARVRRPTIKPEDASGIERSGFRSAMDKRSDDVRSGLSKAFSFGRKSKKASAQDARAPSSVGYSHPGDHDFQQNAEVPAMPAMPAMHAPNPPAMPSWRPEMGLPPPPSTQLPPLPTHLAGPAIKRWIGAGRPVQRWNKLRKDPELWDPNGDVLVYLTQRGQVPKPNPSFRLSSHIIQATESRFLIQLLRDGSTDDYYDEEQDGMFMPPSPAGVPPMFSRQNPRRHHGHGAAYGRGRGNHALPPTSEDASLDDADGQISYEIYLPTLPELTKSEAHRHAITTRNVFALLYHASLVGLSLYQALSDLHARLDGYMPPDADNVGAILDYLSARGIDDCRNDPEAAVSLLAWSETSAVRWEEGWSEAFLHAVGMYGILETCSDFRHITPITRALLERACLETQLRVQAAEERLAEFSCGDIWPSSGSIANSPAKAAADRLQRFFISHYTAASGSWPPPPSGERSTDGEETWLTRSVAQRLQKDFGALYDYLVNRDIIWDESETRSSRKWMMVSESGNKAFEADTSDLPLTDLLIEWDNRLRFPHIPHPYPLVPDSIPPASASRERPRKSDKDKSRTVEDRALERRVQLAYTEATNIYTLGSEFTQSALTDAFVKFEKTDQIGAVDPQAARRGRWVLIYGILQTLASVSVDTPSVRYKDDVTYHLSPRLKGTRIPPWRGAANPATEAAHELSHCWVAPQTWNVGDVIGEASPILLMRAQAYSLPRQPSAMSVASGWQTPATLSINGHGPPSNWGGSSGISTVSDDAYSVRTPVMTPYAERGREGYRAPRNYPGPGGGGGGGLVAERDDQHGPFPPQDIGVAYSAGQGFRSKPLPPLTINDSVTGHGGFFDLDETTPAVAGRGGASHPTRRGAEKLEMDLVIRDFDELDIIDQHEP